MSHKQRHKQERLFKTCASCGVATAKKTEGLCATCDPRFTKAAHRDKYADKR